MDDKFEEENYEETSFDDSSFDDSNFEDDEFENETSTKNNGMNPVIKWVIICTVALVVGLTVYFVTDALINGGNDNAVVDEDTPMALNNEMVTYLYGNVSYDVRGVRNIIFFKNDKVEADDFSNNDKFFFAFRYITSQDFTAIYEEVEVGSTTTTTTTTETTKTDSNGNTSTTTDSSTSSDEEKDTVMVVKEYSISNEVIAAAMEDFFGEGVSYNYDTEIPIGVNFTVNGYNAGNLRYDSTSDSFLIKFNENSDLSVETSPIKPYYGQLVSAIRKAETNHIILKEKVIFTKVTVNEAKTDDADTTYNYSICADYECNEVLETKTGVTKSQYYNDPIEIDDYEDKATTITYTFFKDSVNEYHFLSSEKDK